MVQLHCFCVQVGHPHKNDLFQRREMRPYHSMLVLITVELKQGPMISLSVFRSITDIGRTCLV